MPATVPTLGRPKMPCRHVRSGMRVYGRLLLQMHFIPLRPQRRSLAHYCPQGVCHAATRGLTASAHAPTLEALPASWQPHHAVGPVRAQLAQVCVTPLASHTQDEARHGGFSYAFELLALAAGPCSSLVVTPLKGTGLEHCTISRFSLNQISRQLPGALFRRCRYGNGGLQFSHSEKFSQFSESSQFLRPAETFIGRGFALSSASGVLPHLTRVHWSNSMASDDRRMLPTVALQGDPPPWNTEEGFVETEGNQTKRIQKRTPFIHAQTILLS